MTGGQPLAIVIVGAGHAGGRAAQSLRRQGFTGSITVLGDEIYPPYERPPLSKEVLLGRAKARSTYLASVGDWVALEVDLRLGSAVMSIDRPSCTVALANGDMVGYDALILATGTRARTFSGEVDAFAPVYTLRTIADVQALRPKLRRRARIGVLGAGFIGLELASSALELGASVTVIELADRPLARLLPAEFGRWLAGVHMARGVDLRFGCPVTRLRRDALVLASGEAIEVDAIVVGIGAVPNDQLAAQAGLSVNDGVLVDSQCRTTDAAIYAIGDVARRLDRDGRLAPRIESWRKAEDDAARVAAVLCGAQLADFDVPWFWTDQHGHNIQLAGEPSDRFRAVLKGDLQTGPFIIYYLDGAVLRGVIGVDCGRDVRAAQKLVRDGTTVDDAMLRAPRTKAGPLIVPLE